MNFPQTGGRPIGAASSYGLQVTAISLSKKVFTADDAITIAFKLKNTSNSIMMLGNPVQLICVVNGTKYALSASYTVSGSIGAGATKTYRFQSAIASQDIQTILLNAGERAGFGLMLDIGFGADRHERWNLATTYGILDAYYGPSIASGFNAQRWNATTGAADDESTALALTAQIAHATTPPSGFFTPTIRYIADATVTPTTGTAVDLTSRLADLLAGVTNDTTLLTGTFSAGSDYTFLLTYGDAYEMAMSAVISVASAFANVHFSGASTGGVAFGKFSASTLNNPLFECGYPASFLGGVVLAELLKVESATDTVTMGSGTTSANITLPLSPGAGWTPVAVAGYRISNRLVHAQRLYIDGSNARIDISTDGSATVGNVTVIVEVLCVHTG